MNSNTVNEIQTGLLEDAVRIGNLQYEIQALENMLDNPQSAWNLQQVQFQSALAAARNRHDEEIATAVAEAERLAAEERASRPLLQNVWESFIAQANGAELALMADRNQLFGVGWWLDIQSPFFLDLPTDPVKALVSSAFRAIRLTRFESQLRNRKSRLSQFRVLKKFPAESGILTFLETSESKSFGLRFVLTQPDAEASVNYLLSLPLSQTSLVKENSHDPAQYR